MYILFVGVPFPFGFNIQVILLPNLMSWRFPSVFSPKNFRVLALGLIHFELIFASDVWKESSFHFSACGYPIFPNTIGWKDCPFHIEWSWHPWRKSFDCVCKGFFFWALILFCWSLWVFMPALNCFDYDSFVISFEIRK